MAKKWYTMKARVLASGGKSGEIDITDEIGMWGVSFNQFRDDLRALGDVESYQLNINSPGGSVFDAIAMCNLLKNTGKTVNARILGYCASSATFLTSIADKVEMPANAFFLIHKPWSYAAGNADELRDLAEMLDKVEGSIMGMYLSKSGKTETEVSGWMKEGDWWTAAEAKEHGFVDEVTAAAGVAACVDSMEGLGNVTESVKAIAGKVDQKDQKGLTWFQKMAALAGLNSGGSATAQDTKAEAATAQERADFEAKSAKLAQDLKSLDEEKKQVEAMAEEVKKMRDSISEEVKKKVAAGVVDAVAALGVSETQLPASEQAEQKMTEKELIALINNSGTPHEERWNASEQLKALRQKQEK